MWNSILELFRNALASLHGLIEPLAGVDSWGWAIIALTLVVRLLLLPLGLKQSRSLRAMQALQPKLKTLQEKHKAPRELARADPQEFAKRRQALNQEMMALYKQEGVNPASGCLPLLLQMPIFIALFSVLRSFPDLQNAPFYFFTRSVVAQAGGPSGLGALVKQAGWSGWLLIGLMAATTFLAQRQTIAQSSTMPETALTQQKVMLYVMPVFLVFVSWGLPIGVMIYWVTTNLWQIGQQAIIWREIETHPGTAEERRQAIAKKVAALKGPGPKGGGSGPGGKGKKAGGGKKA